MALSFNTLAAKSVGGTTTVAIPIGASAVPAGSLIVLARCLWLSTATATNETGWTPSAELTGGTGTAIDAHTTRLRLDYKVAVGTEAGTTITLDNAGTISGGIGQSIVLKKDAAKAWSFDSRIATDDAHGTGRSVTFGTALDVIADDLLIIFIAVDSDASFSQGAGSVMTGTATYLSPPTSISPSATGVLTGVDGNLMVQRAIVDGAGTVTGYTSDATASSCGPVAVLRLREVSASRPRQPAVSNPALRRSYTY